MLALGVGLGLAAPAPLGRMDSQEVSDFTADYSQLQVLQPAADTQPHITVNMSKP